MKNYKKVFVYLFSFMLLFSMSVFVSTAHAQEDDGYPCIPYNDCIANSTDAATKTWIAHDSSDGRASKCTSGYGRCISQTGVPLNVPIPTLQGGQIDSVASIDVYINVIFLWLLRLGGVVAALVIVWGGYTYLTSAGNQARTSQAKEILTGGIVGLALLFGSVAILSFINTRLVNNAPITVDVVQPQQVNLGFCENSPEPADKSECGSPVKDTADNSNCISDWCLNNKTCVPATISGPGIGLSGSTNGYGCVDTSSLDLEDICEDDALPHQCSYIAQIAVSEDPGNTCVASEGSCVYGEILDCNSDETRLDCSQCGFDSSNIETYLDHAVSSGILTPLELTLGDTPNIATVVCANSSEPQASYRSGARRGGICCRDSAGKNVIRVVNTD
ncbi:MAG: pilin [Patescibacteria group bacterium]